MTAGARWSKGLWPEWAASAPAEGIAGAEAMLTRLHEATGRLLERSRLESFLRKLGFVPEDPEEDDDGWGFRLRTAYCLHRVAARIGPDDVGLTMEALPADDRDGWRPGLERTDSASGHVEVVEATLEEHGRLAVEFSLRVDGGRVGAHGPVEVFTDADAAMRAMLTRLLREVAPELTRCIALREGDAIWLEATPRVRAPIPEGDAIELYDHVEVSRNLEDEEDDRSGAARKRRAIATRGAEGARRRLFQAGAADVEAVRALGARAPHLVAAIEEVARQAALSAVTGSPLATPPLLLLGPPGTGKSWLMNRIAETLGIPFTKASMNTATLSDVFTGSHPSWRGSREGCVARMLLASESASGFCLVDEFDKPQVNGWMRDPYAPFYTLLEPESAAAFVDDHLQFAMDASHLSWVMSANSTAGIPETIMTRMTVIELPEMDRGAKEVVIASIMADLNRARRSWFEEELAPDVVDVLAGHAPRRVRMGLLDAMARAATDGRRALRTEDLRSLGARPGRRYGFGR